MFSRKLLASLMLVIVVAVLSAPVYAESMAMGNGLSSAEDAETAGIEAATTAKKMLGDTAAKLVLVFDNKEATETQKLLKGVCSVFDKSIVYGCPAYAPLNQESNQEQVGVMALGGDLEIATAIAKMTGDYTACGKEIGERLKAATEVDATGKLLILFGDCHVPDDDKLVKGACSVLGETFQAVGAASLGGNVYHQGNVVEKSNIGILITGDFSCGFSMKKDNSDEGLIRSAKDTIAEAIGDAKPDMAFVFDCGGRRGMMKDNAPKELEAMKSASGDMPFFGFYGSGEIGHRKNGEPSCGDGYHISVCAITTH